jgi:hypothetical protein
MAAALAAKCLHTTGTLDVMTDPGWPQADADYLGRSGFKVRSGPGAHLSAVSFNAATGDYASGIR